MNQFQQIRTIFRDLKWIIAVCLLVCAIIYLPDQVRELFRVSAAEGGRIAIAQFAALILISLFIYFGALQVTTQTLTSAAFSGLSVTIAQLTIALLTGLPLFLAAIAQKLAKPTINPANVKALREVGSVYRVQADSLSADGRTLDRYFWYLLAISLAAMVASYLLSERIRSLSAFANSRYFSKPPYLLVTVVFTMVVTAVFVWFPVVVPQSLGPFGILAVFTLCVVAFSVHFSLLTIEHGVPYLPILLLWGLLLSAWDLNDNHTIRKATSDAQAVHTQAPRLAAGEAFIGWLKQQHSQSKKAAATQREGLEFPVFIVSAQGGGIYAAYNTAIFLARIQDRCPAFRDHLFAISSVSGGSVGAATFATALHASDQTRVVSPRLKQIATSGPCPDITRFLSGAQAIDDIDRIGTVEENVDKALSTDFLSPLAAAALFPNFAQFFIPGPIEPFDRARALEYTLESAAETMYPRARTPAAKNLMMAGYQEHWQPQSSLPALLMNATGSGSGKRVVISPFDLAKANPINTDICVLANIGASERTSSAALNLPLSTAAFVSARFPWITPAATVDIKNPCISKKNKVRLVDGGYIDNSGVETALNLIEEISAAADAAQKVNPSEIPRIRIYLISLTGGDFPDGGEFSYNELVEPIRALLSGRESRAYVALNRAKAQLKVSIASDGAALSSFNRSDLNSHFYNLPLGWAISENTRDIIAHGSGRYWDCEPSEDFTQTRPHLANADCMHLQIYHALSRTLSTAEGEHADAIKGVDLAAKALKLEKSSPPRVDHEKLLACYEENWWQVRSKRRWDARRAAWEKRDRKNRPAEFPAYKQQYLSYYQSEHVRELLREWDRSPQFDQNILAYLLGSVSYDSSDFRRTSENVSFSTEAAIRRYWRDRIDLINKQRREANPAANDVDLKPFLNNPSGLAGLVWGWPKNRFGNKDEKDAWRYRARGIYQRVGREQYQQSSQWLKQVYPWLTISLTEKPDVLAHRAISAKVTFAHFANNRYGEEKETLVSMLRKYPGDWKRVRTRQIDMSIATAAVNEIADRSTVFQKCIAEAEKSLQVAVPR